MQSLTRGNTRCITLVQVIQTLTCFGDCIRFHTDWIRSRQSRCHNCRRGKKNVENSSDTAREIILPQPWVVEVLWDSQLVPYNFPRKVHLFPDFRLLYQFLRVTVRYIRIWSFDTLCQSIVECILKTQRTFCNNFELLFIII